MAVVELDPQDPDAQCLDRAAQVVHRGGVIVYPTDSSYALGCRIYKNAADRIRQIRELDRYHDFALACVDLAEISTYARVSEANRGILEAHTPGPYTFVLPATREVPRRLMREKKNTVGLRVPDHPVALGLLERLDEPILTTTLQLPGDGGPLTDPVEIKRRLERLVDLVIDSGQGADAPTTVVDLTGAEPEVLRRGAGVFPR